MTLPPNTNLRVSQLRHPRSPHPLTHTTPKSNTSLKATRARLQRRLARKRLSLKVRRLQIIRSVRLLRQLRTALRSGRKLKRKHLKLIPLLWGQGYSLFTLAAPRIFAHYRGKTPITPAYRTKYLDAVSGMVDQLQNQRYEICTDRTTSSRKLRSKRRTRKARRRKM
jgi:hypothetical protein